MKTTRHWLSVLLVAMGLLWFAVPAAAQSPTPSPSAMPSPAPIKGPPLPDKPVTHILLLDVSGSLRTRGYAARDEKGYKSHWTQPYLDLLTHLLQPTDAYFRPTDLFVVQTFSEAMTEAKERNPIIGPLRLADLATSAARFPAPGGGATNMVHGLELDRQLAQIFESHSGAVVTWLITDNENNWQSSQDDRGFYQRLRDDPTYRYVHFFPIADPERPGDSLVMYMMVHKSGDEPLWVPTMVNDTEQRLGAVATLFRPLYTNPGDSGLALDKNVTYRDPATPDVDTPLEQEGNALVMHLNEGQSMDGELRLKIRSTLKGWKLDNARLSGQTALTVPDGYRDTAGPLKVVWHFSPSALTVDPEGETSVYRLSPDGQPPRFSRTVGEWLSDPTAEWLKEVDGHFTMTANIDLQHNQIQPLQDPAARERLHFVHDLDKISAYMTLQADKNGSSQTASRTISMDRPFVIRIHASNVARFLVLGGLALLLLLAALVGFAGFAWKSHYTLEGPSGTEPVVMPYVRGSRLLMEPSGIILGRLQQSFGALTFRPEEGVTMNGEARPMPVVLAAGECRFETKREQAPPQVWVLSRQQHATRHDAAGDGPTL